MLKQTWRKVRPYRFGVAASALWGALQVLGVTSEYLGYALLVISALLFVSPIIEAAQGIRLQFDPNPNVPKKRKKIIQLEQPFSYGLMVAALVIFAILAFSKRSVIVNASLSAKHGQQSGLETIVGKRFENTAVVLDNHEYVECTFKNVFFRWDGAPYAMINAHMETPKGSVVGVGSINPTIKETIELLVNLNLTKGDLRPAITPVSP